MCLKHKGIHFAMTVYGIWAMKYLLLDMHFSSIILNFCEILVPLTAFAVKPSEKCQMRPQCLSILYNRMKRSASSWMNPTCWTPVSWSAWTHCWPTVKSPACLRVMSTQHWWHSARREQWERASCWTRLKNCTSGSHSRLAELTLMTFYLCSQVPFWSLPRKSCSLLVID